MKKMLAMILALCMLLSLCACGDNSDMMKELKTGTWTRNFDVMGTAFSETFSFKNEGEYVCASLIGGDSGTTEYGTYVVTDTTIDMTSESGETRSIYYTFEDGYLELTMRGGAGEWQLIHNQ